jgi:hypothetical protein
VLGREWFAHRHGVTYELDFDVRVFDVHDRTHWRRRSDRAMMPGASFMFSLQC